MVSRILMSIWSFGALCFGLLLLGLGGQKYPQPYTPHPKSGTDELRMTLHKALSCLAGGVVLGSMITGC